MARTLSQDLRGRVVAASGGGRNCHAAAARFGVSISSAIRWRGLALEYGRTVSNRCGGDMDNFSSHRLAAVKERIEAAGATLRFRPP